MKIILVDDEPLILEELEYLCAPLPGVEVVGAFTDPAQALACVRNQAVDFAFLDISMPGMSGLELLRSLRGVQRNLQAAFVTAYDQYALDAYRADACDYLLKPFGEAEVRHALDKARRLLGEDRLDRVEFRTFGRFDLFLNGRAVDFKSRKAKELLALLVLHKGGTVEMELAIETLWENEPFDDKVKVKFRKTCMSLRESLRARGLLWLLQSQRGRLNLECAGVECDYFRLLEGDRSAARQFHGALMSEYSWTEPYLPGLEAQARRLLEEPGQ
ncbi:response regulator [Pseudoflavonifractor phocaeensis]|uniref:response regulator n=1 Tax=Pseudoflavonifractor phocaeensis TaxID=1870988 RepID=UPI00195EDADF|nr:response regulator [Pseudoflavonifractor phocaeensis]MBM6870318.1 response regulator [Pseudoflavonifractor phocaeensis]MBM6939299.1 response regulator [Pseudoflavonifractor phocaeensis]